jgi:hypothetical protein
MFGRGEIQTAFKRRNEDDFGEDKGDKEDEASNK